VSSALVAKIDVRAIRTAIQDALAAADAAVHKAVAAGSMLNDARPHVGHGNWMAWVAESFPEISHDTAERWMAHAKRITGFVLRDHRPSVPVSQLLNGDGDELNEADTEARQLLLDFMANKTIKEALAAAVTEGDDARAARAVAGKSTGGTRGENRKDFPRFAARHLSDLTYHLAPFEKFGDDEVEIVARAMREQVARWPRPALELFAEAAKSDLKRRDGKA
jgi:hypothetical protein